MKKEFSFTVVIRSYKRIQYLLELLDRVLSQDYPDFEIVVIEQSGDEILKYEKEIARFEEDPKVRIIRTEPLGPAGARNEAMKHAKGEIILFIDDDDLPLDNNWISAHAANYKDDEVIGVSGREVHKIGEKCGYSNRKKALKYCLSYDFWGYPYVYCRLDSRVDRVQWLHGSNASVRLEYAKKVGGWDPDFYDHEEHSFAFRLKKMLKEKRLVFDPVPVMLRRKNIEGGLEREKASPFLVFKRNFVYFHKIIGVYRPFRFVFLYPFYIIIIFVLTLHSWYKNRNNRKNTEIRKKILFWNTTFQADSLTLARFLSLDPRFKVAVALTEKNSLKNEAVHKLIPLDCELFDRDSSDIFSKIRKFDPAVTIVDNHFPQKRLSKYLFVLWHGFGWKGPNDVKEFSEVHKSVNRLTNCSGMKPNSFFRWQCFGPTDLKHRNAISGFARENLLELGSAFTDDIINPPLTKNVMLGSYPENFRNRKIVLIACTWHYGKMFAHWGDDIEILEKLMEILNEKNYAVILRLHDKKRFDPAYLGLLEQFASRHENVLLKFKDSDRDNLIDISVSDIMISNFSSILNYFYATLRPSIHIYPVKSSQEAFIWRVWKKSCISCTEVSSADFVWKLPPEENGGILVKTPDEFFKAVLTADSDPGCCAVKSMEFMQKHMSPVDGKTSLRIADALYDFISN